ncbi:ATP-binding protein [Telmatospirillum sp. J64-1]|uniref:ATP-binding protein n=1 Tax=Telmatospirillum sp. J64-1 TaxID=2502183 RepID=UPI00163DE171|nr:ATP-binding protein [Telmatospirillum sp. J64-1]
MASHDRSAANWDEGLSLSVNSPTAYESDLARQLCQAVATRITLDDGKRMVMETALHEAIANAVQHGNLEVGSLLRQNFEDYFAYCAQLESRLADPRYANRRVHVQAGWSDSHVTFRVRDEGPGFNPKAVPPHRPDRKSGRGLTLILEIADRVEFSENGRCITMVFRR